MVSTHRAIARDALCSKPTTGSSFHSEWAISRLMSILHRQEAQSVNAPEDGQHPPRNSKGCLVFEADDWVILPLGVGDFPLDVDLTSPGSSERKRPRRWSAPTAQ